MPRFAAQQAGIALLTITFILVIVATGFYVRQLSGQDIEVRRGVKTAEALQEAKSALIGWSVSHPIHPGIMPFPDRSTDGNYDGNSDCTSSAMPGFNLLIGRLPYLGQTTPCAASAPGLASSLVDGDGEQLWYAVSRNLIRSSAVATAPNKPTINPNIINSPTESWLVVRDKNGRIISDRVAVVIMAPSAPLGAQDRSGGLSGPEAYLDQITIAGTSYSNADYTSGNKNFVISDDMKAVSKIDARYSHPYEFNDKLVYITIDELMAVLEKRVIAEVAASLKNYYLASASIAADRYYPYAATLGDATHTCVDDQLQGALPLVDCVSSGLTLPGWFTQNGWHDFIYYAVSSDCHMNHAGCALGNITVGTQTNVDAIMIYAGAPIGTQVRPSSLEADYLDSIENTDGDDVFDAVGTVLTNTYNDQILIVEH